MTRTLVAAAGILAAAFFAASTAQANDKCWAVKDDARTQCLYNDAVFSGSIEKCTELLNPDYELQCKKDIALNKKDPSLCSQINDDYHRQICISAIAIANADLTLCERLTAQTECIADVAAAKHDPDICGRISDGSQRRLCEARATDPCQKAEELECNADVRCTWMAVGPRRECCPKAFPAARCKP